VCLPVNLPLHHKVQKFSSGTNSPGWSRKKGHKTVVLRCGGVDIGMFCKCTEVAELQICMIN